MFTTGFPRGRRRLVALVASIVGGLAVVACGSRPATTTATVPPGALEVDAVANLLVDKQQYTAVSHNGQVVIAYVNKDTQRHTLVVADSSGILQATKLEVVKLGDVSVGAYNLTPGSYLIVCDVPGHSRTMRATLTVT